MKKCISLLLAVTLCLTITGCAIQTATTSSDSTTSSGSSSNDASLTLSSAPMSADSTTSSSNSLNDSSQTSSSSNDTPTYPNEKVEELIKKRHEERKYHVVNEKYEGIYLSFEEGKKIHIPIPSIGPGLVQAHDIFLQNDILAIAHFSEKSPNSVSFLITTDQAKSWQSSELEVDFPQGFYELALRNTEDGIFILQDRDIVTNQSRGDQIIYTTDNMGKTWKKAGTLSGDYPIYELGVMGNSYWVAGRTKTRYPAILKSDDGVHWSEAQLSLDATKYKSGFCNEVYLSGEIGLADVAGETADNNTVAMVYVSVDGGETWSFYKNGHM